MVRRLERFDRRRGRMIEIIARTDPSEDVVTVLSISMYICVVAAVDGSNRPLSALHEVNGIVMN